MRGRKKSRGLGKPCTFSTLWSADAQNYDYGSYGYGGGSRFYDPIVAWDSPSYSLGHNHDLDVSYPKMKFFNANRPTPSASNDAFVQIYKETKEALLADMERTLNQQCIGDLSHFTWDRLVGVTESAQTNQQVWERRHGEHWVK